MDILINTLDMIFETIFSVFDLFLIFLNALISFISGITSAFASVYNECLGMFGVAATYLSTLPTKVWLYMFVSFSFSLILYFINKARGD